MFGLSIMRSAKPAGNQESKRSEAGAERSRKHGCFEDCFASSAKNRLELQRIVDLVATRRLLLIS